MHPNAFGGRAGPGPAGGAIQRSPRLPRWIIWGRERKEKNGAGNGKGGRGGDMKGRKRGSLPQFLKCVDAHGGLPRVVFPKSLCRVVSIRATSLSEKSRRQVPGLGLEICVS